MAQLCNKITTNRLLVQLPSCIIKTRAIAVSSLEKKKKKKQKKKLLPPILLQKKIGKIQTFSTVRKSLNTHGTLSVYLLCRLLLVRCLKKKIGLAKSSIVGLEVIQRFYQP